MTKTGNSKPVYDSEERSACWRIAKRIRLYVKKLPKSIANIEDSKQVVKAYGSVGANYIEANESFSDKDFKYRIKISRKESKESAYFLRLIYETNPPEFEEDGKVLYSEAIQLKKILSTILNKST